MAFWIRRRYLLSPRDPRFLALTPEEVAAEYWAHHYADQPQGVSEVEDEDYDADAMLAALENGADWEDVIRD